MPCRYPSALLILCAAEVCERFAASLVAALLLFYLTERIGLAEGRALELSGLFYALTYLGAIGGGLLADSVVGYRRALLLGAMVLTLGYALLAQDEPARLFLAGAVLIIGHSLFKPTISASIGRLYQPGDQGRGPAYNLFYLAVNVGSALGPVVGSAARLARGWRAAFLVAVTGMVIGLLLLLLRRPELAPRERELNLTPEHAGRSPVLLGPRLHLLGLLLVGLVIHGLAYFQTGGTLLLFARDATRRTIAGVTLPPSLFAALPAVLTIAFAPPLTTLRTRQVARGQVCATRWYLALGAVATAAGFVVLMVADFSRSEPMVSPLWLIGALTLMTLGEVLIVPASMELVSRWAPPRLPALSLALWCVAIAVGQWLAGGIGQWWSRWPHHVFFAAMVLVSVGSGLVFLMLNKEG